MKKMLVAYFSCSGTTAELSKRIANIVNGDLFEIKPEIPYTLADLNWVDKHSRSTLEMENESSRPAIANKLSNMKDYDVVFIGFPVWWYIAPKIINTFLESYDFTQKIIVPFCTSHGSGVGKTDDSLFPSAPNAIFRPARVLNDVTERDLKEWIEELKLQ